MGAEPDLPRRLPERGSATSTPLNVSYRVGRVAARVTGRWLDVGSADGGYSSALLDAGATRVVGIDVERDRIAAATQRRLRAASFCAAASEGLPFADGSFDGVWLNEVFEHVADEGVSLREIHRVLAPHGQLILISPNRWFPFEGHGLRSRNHSYGRPAPFVPWLPRSLTQRVMTARNYWPHELRRAVEAAGFEVAELSFVWPVFERYRWLPSRVIDAYQRRLATMHAVPGVRRFGVSTLIVASRR